MKQAFQQVKSFVEKRATILKLIFVLSVLIFVTFEIGKIFREVDWYQVKQGLADQSLFSIILMLGAGIIAVSPMLLYVFRSLNFYQINTVRGISYAVGGSPIPRQTLLALVAF